MERLPQWGVRGAAPVAALTAALALVVVLAVTPGPAAAEPVDESGYWWRYQAVAGSPLAPVGVTEGQLHVAADAAGAVAVAAVRVVVGEGVVDALVLVESAAAGEPSLRACPTSGWAAPDGAGAYADRPSDERCPDESVAGARDPDGTWRFDVGALVADGVLDVVIVPGAGDQSVTFETPGAGAVVLAPAASTTTTPTTTSAPVASAAPLPIAPSPLAPLAALGDLAAGAPSSGLAAAPSGVPAAALDRDVDAFPAPPRPAGDGRSGGGRAPLALLAVAVPAVAWTYRARAALTAAGGHVLAQPLRHRRDALASVAATVAGDGVDAGGGQA